MATGEGNTGTVDMAEQTESLIASFASNSSYINENYVQYFQNELHKSPSPSHNELMTTTDSMKTYIVDSLCSITEHIGQISEQLSRYIQQQQDELNVLNMRIQSVGDSFQASHDLVGKKHKEELRHQSINHNQPGSD